MGVLGHVWIFWTSLVYDESERSKEENLLVSLDQHHSYIVTP